ncbi:MAG: dihydroneopterin aldolase [Caulobacterales bacterium]|nr:dihydroneopterin aldolase [Caulobacterales bacterium]
MSGPVETAARAPAATAVTGWTVSIRQLEVMASIGVHPHEQGRTQRVLVDVELDLAASAPPREDRIAETVDYESIARAVEALARRGHVQLVETLADAIAAWCLEDDPRVRRARVRVEKPEALRNAAAAGCEITRERR